MDPFSKITTFSQENNFNPRLQFQIGKPSKTAGKKNHGWEYRKQKKGCGIYTKKNEIQRFNQVWQKMNGEMFGTCILLFKKETIWGTCIYVTNLGGGYSEDILSQDPCHRFNVWCRFCGSNSCSTWICTTADTCRKWMNMGRCQCSNSNMGGYMIYLGCSPLPVTVTTRIITYLVGDSYKPSFATVTWRGPHPKYIYLPRINMKQLE